LREADPRFGNDEAEGEADPEGHAEEFMGGEMGGGWWLRNGQVRHENAEPAIFAPSGMSQHEEPTLGRRFTAAAAFITLDRTMWNVEEKFSPKAIESLAALGFAVGSTRGVVRVEKYGSGAEFRKGTDGSFQMTILPTAMLKGQFTRLWDAGYQKFLLTDDGVKIPALAQHLQNLRKFNEELRTALGVPTFYNEALGSVSQVSVYDRVKGRPGDIPDKTVGAHTETGGH
jgi:hypothetical protein